MCIYLTECLYIYIQVVSINLKKHFFIWHVKCFKTWKIQQFISLLFIIGIEKLGSPLCAICLLKFKTFSFEIVKGKKDNSSWLVVDKKYILHKNGSYCNGSADWEWKYRRELSCPFRLKTEKDGNAIWMYDPKVHTCDPDPIDLVHRFKLQVKKNELCIKA